MNKRGLFITLGILLLAAMLALVFMRQAILSASQESGPDKPTGPQAGISHQFEERSHPSLVERIHSTDENPSNTTRPRPTPHFSQPENLHSALVTAELEEGETLVMGGYRKPDGSHEFILISPQRVAIEGQESQIQLQSRVLSYAPEHLERNGLTGLATDKRNADGKSKIWRLEERTNSLQQASQFTASPSVTVTAGEAARVHLGDGNGGRDFTLEVTARMTEGGGFSLEALTERNPGGNH